MEQGGAGGGGEIRRGQVADDNNNDGGGGMLCCRRGDMFCDCIMLIVCLIGLIFTIQFFNSHKKTFYMYFWLPMSFNYP